MTKSYIYSSKAQILCQRNGDASANEYFYVADRLGSIRQLIDSAGNIVRHYTYSPFGQTLETTGTFYNPFRFTGQWYDSEISQYYLWARMYDPYMMRFTAKDPAKGKVNQPLTFHEYLYCLNDPINRIDPEGEFSAVLANAVITGAALYSHGISLACYAVSSGDDRFWDLAEVTFNTMIPAMLYALSNPLGPITRLIVWDVENVVEYSTRIVTGLTPEGALAMDVAAYSLYYAAMLVTEIELGISSTDMEDFIEWNWDF